MSPLELRVASPPPALLSSTALRVKRERLFCCCLKKKAFVVVVVAASEESFEARNDQGEVREVKEAAAVVRAAAGVAGVEEKAETDFEKVEMGPETEEEVTVSGVVALFSAAAVSSSGGNQLVVVDVAERRRRMWRRLACSPARFFQSCSLCMRATLSMKSARFTCGEREGNRERKAMQSVREKTLSYITHPCIVNQK
jgi:hypothetical protein